MIKRRLKYTASFLRYGFQCCFRLCWSAMASGSVGYGSFLVCYACAVSDQKKIIVVSAVNVV